MVSSGNFGVRLLGVSHGRYNDEIQHWHIWRTGFNARPMDHSIFNHALNQTLLDLQTVDEHPYIIQMTKLQMISFTQGDSVLTQGGFGFAQVKAAGAQPKGLNQNQRPKKSNRVYRGTRLGHWTVNIILDYHAETSLSDIIDLATENRKLASLNLWDGYIWKQTGEK
jgi:hypothetical protein